MFIAGRPALRLAVLFVVGLVSTGTPLRAQDRDRLLRETAAVRAMSEAEVIALVPKQSGLQYVDCPNCEAGRQERQLVWTLERPDEVSCQFCKHRYPSAKYPDDKSVVVKTPLGNEARFDYWENESGYRHFFKARRDDEVRRYLASQARALANLYSVTKDRAHARRAAVILDRFAQVFPDWCYHFDYPFQQKQIYDGDVSPAEYRLGFRTARWNWWAYGDIPTELLRAYELIRESGVLAELSKEQGVDVVARIENDLLRNASEQVVNNRDELSNMSPGMWSDLVRVGQTLKEPRYVHEVVRRYRHLIATKFFYDGTWYEGAPSYGQQTVNALQGFARTVRGYSDPPGFVDAVDQTRFDNLNLEDETPQLARARYLLNRLKFPNGRAVPVHDTWANDRSRQGLMPPASYVLPALGHACLTSGPAETPTEWHLTWSGGYGHSHADVLGLLLFSGNRETLSDLGYTHTAYRAWTIASAAHNLVVIDGKSQASGSQRSPTDGSLLTLDTRHPQVQVVRVDGGRGYPKVGGKYERTLVSVDAGAGVRYAVDVFDVAGGNVHDYFLHGDADSAGSIRISGVDLKERGSLLPEGQKWKAPTNEGQSGRAYEPYDAYGFLQKLQSGLVDPGRPPVVEFRVGDQPTVRVTLLAEPGSELVVGENPAIRGADEDDAQLGKFSRPFMMLRHGAMGGASRFVAVLEPTAGPGMIKSVRRFEPRPGVLVLDVEAGSTRQVIVIGAPVETEIMTGAIPAGRVTFRGDVGVLTADEKGMAFAYSLGEGGWNIENRRIESPAPEKGLLVRIEDDAIVVNGVATAPLPNDVIRLVTEDGWVYPFTVVSTEPAGDSLRIRVLETTAMELDTAKKTFELKCFPGRMHQGAVSVEWLASQLDDLSETKKEPN
ncbi:Heparinase II/III-like protein [Caulifigura coniformis]|uniref:Heparinase II/III-like protein n=2 Tax=Caulifigura coniformis TaxID=2527983 RepID=A0A517SLI5_9PLAN|nr:Heparinase II/III-like protein [Caulifigura coniformis]